MNNNYDKLIDKLFYTKRLRHGIHIKFINNLSKYSSIYNYLLNRYNNFFSIEETLYRIHNNFENEKICKNCGTVISYLIKSNFCCEKCKRKSQVNETRKNVIKKYNVENVAQIESVKEKIKKTSLERYNCSSWLGSKESREHAKEKCLKEYGVENYMQVNEIKEKIKQTKIERYGYENTFCNKEIQQKAAQLCHTEKANKKRIRTCIKKYDCDNVSKSEHVKKIISEDKERLIKAHNTKKINGTYKKSIEEDKVYNKLLEFFNKEDIDRQHKSDLYPFNCDFYVFSLDLYIEFQGTWTHGDHPFDINNNEDKYILERFKEKSKHSKYYNAAIYTWTDLDVKKRTTARKNNLNWIEFFSYNEFEQWINLYKYYINNIYENKVSTYEDEFVNMIFNINKDREFFRIQNIDFPSKKEIKEKEIENEIYKLVNEQQSLERNSAIIRKYHKSIMFANKENKLSPYDGWHQIKSSMSLFSLLYKNRIKYSKWSTNRNNYIKLLCGILPEYVYNEGMTVMKLFPQVSYFKPQLSRYIINKYLNEYNEIFDPFSGYSGRMLGCIALGKNYIGQDLCKTSVNESNVIINDYLEQFKKLTQYDISCSIENKDIFNSFGTYECLMTCPPYKNKEIWPSVKSENMSCDDWIDICLSHFKCNKYIFVVDETIKYKDKIVEEIENKSHFNTNKEYIIVL